MLCRKRFVYLQIVGPVKPIPPHCAHLAAPRTAAEGAVPVEHGLML